MNICKRIIWDLGQHDVQNPGNYSYQIIDPYIEGCKRYHVIAYYQISYVYAFKCSSQSPYYPIVRVLVDGDYAQRYSQPFAFSPKVTHLFSSEFHRSCGTAKKADFLIEQFTDSQCRNKISRVVAFETGAKDIILDKIEFREALSTIKPPIKLKIIDGGVESLHSINNRNSVYVEDYECCPPDTIDCSDCCLDCTMVYNSISSMRQSLLNKFNVK